jgi:hypothetical protein
MMFGGVTIASLGREAAEVLGLLYSLQEFDTPRQTQAACLLHQARQNLRRMSTALQSYRLACEQPGQDKEFVQKEGDHAPSQAPHPLRSSSVQSDDDPARR